MIGACGSLITAAGACATRAQEGAKANVENNSFSRIKIAAVCASQPIIDRQQRRRPDDRTVWRLHDDELCCTPVMMMVMG